MLKANRPSIFFKLIKSIDFKTKRENCKSNSITVIVLQTILTPEPHINSYTWCFLFEKINLRVQRNNTQNLECKEVRDQF